MNTSGIKIPKGGRIADAVSRRGRVTFMLITAMAGMATAGEPPEREVIPAKAGGPPVSAERMKEIYEEIKTPYKYGVVLKGAGGRMVDSPGVFRHGDKWHMVYITFDGTGYETMLAVSDNLLDWKPLGTILPFRENTWDAKQAAGYIALQDHRWGGSATLARHDGRYWISYLGGNLPGYETDPMRIGMAVSHDMKTWLRYGREPVVDNGKGLSGDPQLVKIGDTWVMFYFGAFYKPKAFETFAASHDLVTWTKWDGPHLIEPSEPWDATYAHKPWVIKHEGVVYHFHNAVGNQGRVIALATSKDLKADASGK